MSEEVDKWETYRDIKWLMEAIDVSVCLDRLDVRMTSRSGLNWEGFCPDHYLFKGCEPSDPRWYINIENGKTICYTEPRGSNLVFITARLLKAKSKAGKTAITPEDCEAAVKFLLGRDCSESEIAFMKSQRRLQSLAVQEKPKSETVKTWTSEVEILMNNGYLSDRAIQFFMTPPDKAATNISLDTLKHFRVYERTSGTYCNRAIIPVLMNKEVQGFVAVDTLGKKLWLERHPTVEPKKYRKTLYPSTSTGFFRSNVLFGYDECETNADFIIITEGAREVMKLWQEGFHNSVAILGSYMSDEQLMLLTKLAPKKVILMFDGDFAGRNIATAVSEKIQELFYIQVVELPEHVDPKQLNRNDFEKLIFVDK